MVSDMNNLLNASNLNNLRIKYGEAFYILNSKHFRENFIELKNTFSSIYPNFNIAYSYKTNYSPILCRIVDCLGGYSEVVSEMELELALKLGVDPYNVIWNGPIKKSSVVEEFLLNGGLINIDSLEELYTIKKIVSKHLNYNFRLEIRCNFDVNDGVISRFGFDVDGDDFKEAIFFLLETNNVKLVNLQCHFAKRQIEYWENRTKRMIELIDKLGFVPDRVDLGGALFGKMEKSLNEQFECAVPNYIDYATIIAKEFYRRFGKRGPQLIIEPGTALVGDCMSFVGTVKSIKNIRGKYFATVLGSQKNINMCGVNPPIKIIPCGTTHNMFNSIDLVGYTCIEGDVIYKGYCGEIEVGDFVVISNCGSYSLVMKPPFILPNFPVIDISNGKEEIIKRAETFDDIFTSYNF